MKGRNISRETRFTLGELLDMLARGSGVGSAECQALELLEKAFREGPLGRRLEEELREQRLAEQYTDFGGLSAEDVLALLERGFPIGYDESSFLVAVQKAGYRCER